MLTRDYLSDHVRRRKADNSGDKSNSRVVVLSRGKCRVRGRARSAGFAVPSLFDGIYVLFVCRRLRGHHIYLSAAMHRTWLEH